MWEFLKIFWTSLQTARQSRLEYYRQDQLEFRQSNEVPEDRHGLPVSLKRDAALYFMMKELKTLSIVQTFKGTDKTVPVVIYSDFFPGHDYENILKDPMNCHVLYILQLPGVEKPQCCALPFIYEKIRTGQWIETNGKFDPFLSKGE